jgi:hypothetical protein
MEAIRRKEDRDREVFLPKTQDDILLLENNSRKVPSTLEGVLATDFGDRDVVGNSCSTRPFPRTQKSGQNIYSIQGYVFSLYSKTMTTLKSYLVENYQTVFDGTELIQEIAHHTAHCFDYLRLSIMYAADISLEGKTDAGPGWGSKYECTDYDGFLSWANDNDVYKYGKNMPDKAVL